MLVPFLQLKNTIARIIYQPGPIDKQDAPTVKELHWPVLLLNIFDWSNNE